MGSNCRPSRPPREHAVPQSKGVTQVTCNLGDIANGGDSNSAVTVRIQAQITNANLNYAASVASDTLDPNLDNNDASFSTFVTK